MFGGLSFFEVYTIIYHQGSILAVRKVGHLTMKTNMFDFEARVLVGWLAGILASQPIKTRASKSDIFVFMLRWTTFLTADISISTYMMP